MEQEYITKARTFVRVCLHCAKSGVLNLSDEECLRLYREGFIMAEFLQDKLTMIIAGTYLALLFIELQRYDEALQWQQLVLALAIKEEDKTIHIMAYRDLGNIYSLASKFQDALSSYQKAKGIAVEIDDKTYEALCCKNIGAAYHSSGYYSDAIKSYQQCLNIALETNNTMLQKTAYIKMGDVYNEMEDFSQAINCFKEWLKPPTKDDEQERGNVYHGLGLAYQGLKSFHQALKYHQKSLEIAEHLKDKRLKGMAYMGLGRIYFTQGDFQKAIHYYGEGLKCSLELNDINNVAKGYCNLGAAYTRLGNYDLAIELSEKALQIAVIIGNKDVEASANGNLGDVHLSKGDYRQAIKYHERHLQVCTDTGSKERQLSAYNSLGVDYKSLGNYYKSIEYHKKSLEMSVEIGSKIGEEAAHANLGILHEMLGQYHEAIEHHKKSLEIARELKNRYSEGRALGNLGNSFLKTYNEEARNCFQESLKIALEVNDKESVASNYLNLSKCKTLSGDYKEALEMADKQIRLAEEMSGDKSLVAKGYVSKGSVYMKLRDYKKAIDHFKKGLEMSKTTDNRNMEADCNRSLGEAYGRLLSIHHQSNEQEKAMQCIEKAIHYTRESLRCNEWIFDHLQDQDHHKISILETFNRDYKYLSLMLFTSKKPKEALLASERGRARALDDLLVLKYGLHQGNQLGRDPISYSEIENMTSNSSIVFYCLMQPSLQRTFVINSSGSSGLSLNPDWTRLPDIVNAVYKTLRVREVTEGQCEDRSIQTDESPKQTHPWPVPTRKYHAKPNAKMRLSSFEMMNGRCIYEEDLQDVDNPNPLESLYKALISPVNHLLTKEEIVIIPDGAIFTVPFATLRDPNTGKFLSETKRIRLAPSLTSLKALQECPEDFHSKTGALVIGNPNVGKVVFRGKTRHISDLPCAEREAKKIGELLGVKPFIGSQATKETIKQNLREGVAVIHFAAHGTTDGEILLTPSSPDDPPREEDYVLTMKEVQESGARPQLVVLSCCHSGRGEIKAEGVVGMGRAFLAAGARAVVACLWAIADGATMVFMEKFYRHLKQGESASRSLQGAMKDMREMSVYSDAQFWGSFFLIGDDVTIKF